MVVCPSHSSASLSTPPTFGKIAEDEAVIGASHEHVIWLKVSVLRCGDCGEVRVRGVSFVLPGQRADESELLRG